MKDRRNGRNQGSSLMFIIVAVAFVSILATIILRITLINVETKDINRKMQKNHYSTETVMDQVTVTIQNISAEQLRSAYSEVLSSYTSEVVAGGEDENNIQKKFGKLYLNNLINALSSGTSHSYTGMAADGTLPSDAQYNQETIRGKYGTLFSVSNPSDTYLTNKPEECSMVLHYDMLNPNGENYLLLKNIKVKYKDGNYSTTISTDIKLSVPKINFEGGSIYPDFTKFCLIGDERVETGAGNAFGIGNVYAGEYGINILADANFGGSSAKIISRGDIMVNKGSALELGSNTNPVSVWIENYVTTNPTLLTGDAEASLTVYGDSYVHDDLALNSSYSKAVFSSGNYYGYTFNKDNSIDSRTEVDSNYSSAILINGKNSSLTMKSDMASILLGGRAFISREAGRTSVPGAKVSDTDIMIGQSIATKIDQSFYLVDDAYLTNGYSNPMPVSTYQTVSGSSIITNAAKNALKNYLNTKEPVTCYFYKISGSPEAMVYFYYNFKSQTAADKFFQNLSLSEVKKKALNSEYLRFGADADVSGIKISSNLALLTFGNMYTFDNKNDTDSNTLKKPGIDSDNDDFYKDRAIQLSAEYKSYQTKMNDSDANKYNTSSVAEADDESGFNLKNKAADRVYDELMTYDGTRGDYSFVADAKSDSSSATSNGFKKLKDNFWLKCVGVDIGGGKKVYAAFVVDIDTSKFHKQTGQSGDVLNTETPVNMTDILSKMRTDYGFKTDDTMIIASNCNIVVNESVNGLVISAHTVQLSGASVGATAQSAYLQAMFSAQKSLEATASADKKFLTYFVCFSTLNFTSENEDTNINIVRNISYVNWKKNEE